MANVIGPDVSFYQDDPQTPEGIDFRKMRTNAGYVIIRAGQNLWSDRDFKVNWREAKLAGIPRGSYWFYDSRADPKKQAELWASLFNEDFGELPLWADFEDNYNGSFRGWKHWYTFLERIKQLIPGKEIGVYTAYYYWVENTLSVGIPTASLNYFKQYPLWIANYGANSPLIPKPWTEWTFWQFTDNGDGTLYGVESKNIDLNYFNGDAEAFRTRFNIVETPIPEPPPLSKFFRVTVPSLKVREGPGLDYSQVGRILLNEVVEEIGADPNRTWINIKRSVDSLTGWSFSAYLQRVSAPQPTPEPEPEPTPEPPSASKWHRVTTTSLRVREGPGLNYKQIGSIYFNEVVQEIGANDDRSWLEIRKADNSLTGWSSNDYLAETDAPTPTPAPEPTPPPEEEDTNWYRVTASSLKVRSGPGLEHDSIGLVYFGELVEKIGETTDGSWTNIRNQDGTLIGWSYSEYLISVHAPQPTEPPPTTPVPDHKDRTWYRVNTAVLNVREGPGLNHKIIAKVLKNDTLPALDDSTTPGWVQIQKVDGLIGWCSNDYLVMLGNSRPNSIAQTISPGITYLRKDLTSPRPIVVHIMVVDLQTTKLEFLVTPSPDNTDILCTRATSEFLEEFKLHVAVNGGYFSYLDASYASKCTKGDAVRISDYAASRGTIYSPQKTIQPVLYIGQKNQVSFNKLEGKVFNAVAGDRMVVMDRQVVKNLAALAPAPRTAIGVNKNARWLILMVVDGRQPGYSEGVTLPELGELLISYGAHHGANMDGGGSSTMVIQGFDGKARVLNSPIDLGKPGRERAVANHLGLYVRL